MKPSAKSHRVSYALLGEAFPDAQINATDSEIIVKGISVMTVGAARGHFIEVGEGASAKQYQVGIDDKTLADVLAQAATYKTGVKVKADHGSGVFEVIGYLSNFSLGKNARGEDRVAADFHIFKTTERWEHLLQMIKTLPDAIGFSAVMDMIYRKVGDVMFGTVKKLYSVDFVTDPAANPTGVFGAGVDTLRKVEPDELMAEPTPAPTAEQLASACMAAMKPHLDKIHERLGALETRGSVTGTSAGPAAPPADTEAMYSAFKARIIQDPDLRKVVTAELQETAKVITALGLQPGAGPGASAPASAGRPAGAKDVKDMDFMEVVAMEFSRKENESITSAEIIRNVRLSHPEKHATAMKTKDALAKLPARSVPFKAPAHA